jgi:hypothetical protein
VNGVCHRSLTGQSHPMPAAHANPLATSVTPAMKSAISNRVSVQSLRILRSNRWTDRSEQDVFNPINEWLTIFLDPFC